MLIFHVCGVMAVRRVSVEQGTLASHSSATVKASSIPSCTLGLPALSGSLSREQCCRNEHGLATAMHGDEEPWRKLCPFFGLMTVTSSGAIYFLRSV
jgi:hypothetical protein